MGKSEKQMDKEHERNQRIIDTAVSYRITCNNGNQRTLINP